MYKNTRAKRNFWEEHDKFIALLDAKWYRVVRKKV